jgi:uncharacterized membrane protein SpoIIM required for sporulation
VSKKTRVISFGVFVGIFLGSYMIGTTYKMSNEDAETFLKDLQNQTAGIDSVGIFLHNTSISLPMFVPGFGAAWGSYTSWQTGAGFRALVITNPILESMPPLTPLLAPNGIMEVVAYAIGMSRSYLLVWRIIKRNPLRKEIIPTSIEIGIVIALLIIGGYVESFMMEQQA